MTESSHVPLDAVLGRVDLGEIGLPRSVRDSRSRRATTSVAIRPGSGPVMKVAARGPARAEPSGPASCRRRPT
ncbi:hypothetical protein Ae168Ps1_4039 [Pseudonocardia sp. Ae168_Ps1]|nr:hypothetical protein Ae168Ps1_4039 [Pseudonocardia sp. Ae168_Ps1]